MHGLPFAVVHGGDYAGDLGGDGIGVDGRDGSDGVQVDADAAQLGGGRGDRHAWRRLCSLFLASAAATFRWCRTRTNSKTITKMPRKIATHLVCRRLILFSWALLCRRRCRTSILPAGVSTVYTGELAQDVLGEHAAGAEFRALAHQLQNGVLAILGNGRHVLEIDDQFAVLQVGVRRGPGAPELFDPRSA